MNPTHGMRVLMTTDTIGGVWIYALTLARAFAAMGMKINLVTLGPRAQPAQRQLLAGNDRIVVTETDLQLEWQDPEGSDVARSYASLKTIADEFKPDIIHFNSYREA